MALVVLSEHFPRAAIESIIRRTAYLLIPFSLLLIKYFPAYGVGFAEWSGRRMWVGVTQQKNSLGRLCMVIALFLIWSLARRFQKNNPRIWKYQTHVEIVVLGLTLWLLKGPGRASYSATSLLALSLGLFVYGAFYYLKKKGKTIGSGVLMIVMALIIVYGITIVYTGEIKFGSLATGLGRNETFTDRTAIWARIIPVVKQKPIFGGGFGGFWTPTNPDAV